MSELKVQKNKYDQYEVGLILDEMVLKYAIICCQKGYSFNKFKNIIPSALSREFVDGRIFGINNDPPFVEVIHELINGMKVERVKIATNFGEYFSASTLNREQYAALSHEYLHITAVELVEDMLDGY